MNVKDLFGKEVLDARAEMLGKVTDVDVDIEHGVVNHIVVRAGLVRRYIVKPNQIEKLGDRIVLNLSEDQLQRKSMIGM